MMCSNQIHRFSLAILAAALAWNTATGATDSSKRIEIYQPNPAYWQYKGKPILLLRKPAGLNWLNIMESRCMETRQISEGSKIKLTCPSRDYWAVRIKESEG